MSIAKRSSWRPYEKIGAEAGQRSPKKTDDVAGDSTTTATVLAQAWFASLRNVAAGASPLGLKAASKKAVEKVTETLLKSAKEVETKGADRCRRYLRR